MDKEQVSEKLNDPETLAKVLDAAADPLTAVNRLAEEMGLKPWEVQQLVARVRTKYQPVVRELKKAHTGELLGMIEDRVWQALSSIDEGVFGQMREAGKGKDLAIMLGILLEKRQLLRGEPTHILSVEERTSLNDLIPLIIKEAQRRGMAFDDRGPIIDVTPREGPRPIHRDSGALATRKRREEDAIDESGEPR